MAAVTGFFDLDLCELFIMATISAFCSGDILQHITDAQFSARFLNKGTLASLKQFIAKKKFSALQL